MKYYLLSVTSTVALILLLLPFKAYGKELSTLTPEEKAFITNHGPILVHNETDWPPFNFFENGSPQGISIDVMDRIAEITGLQLEYITGASWAEYMEMIRRDELDVMLNINNLPERRDLFLFSSPYVKSLTGVFVKDDGYHNYYTH